MFLFSVSAIMAWFRRRADGQADGFTLFIAILGFIFSLMFLANIWAQIMTAEIMFYMSFVFFARRRLRSETPAQCIQRDAGCR